MTRRSLTLLLATVLALGLAVAGSFATVPYVALKPGPTCNTIAVCDKQQVLSFSPASASHRRRSGELQLTTVSVQDHISLFEAIAGWISPNEAVLPREIVYPPDQTTQQNQQETTQQMVDSQDSATVAALTYLGYKGTATVTVSSVTAGAPAAGKLNPGDVVLTVDGAPVTTGDQLRAKVSARKPGALVTIGYERDGKKAAVV
ncbi:MAG: putative secreted protein, partial [Frankiales bacterium]|nr:putative secreted protein [Frankiales bacterium]